jgi:hypothetical protein
MKKLMFILFAMWLNTSLLANTNSASFYFLFKIDESKVEVKSNYINVKNKPVTCYEFRLNSTNYRYVPPGKKSQGYVEYASDGLKLMNFDPASNCGLNPDNNDTCITITNEIINIFGIPYSYSDNSIQEHLFTDEWYEVGKTDHDFDKFLIASLILIKSSALYEVMKWEYTNKVELTEYIKDKRTRDSAVYVGNRDFFQYRFDSYYQSLSSEEQDILIGKGYDAGGYSRYNIDVESIRTSLDKILEIYDIIGSPDYYVSRYSLGDLYLFETFITTKKKLENDFKAFNRHVEEIKALRKVNEKAKEREQWRQENKFTHEVNVDYTVKSWECSLCHSNCYSHGYVSYSLLTESELSDSEYYLELYNGLKNRTNLALTILYKGCTHSICSESVTGKTQHQWKEINSENKSDILKFENL